MDTGFGIGTIRDAGDKFEIVIDVHEGTLLRSGPLVGKIIKVEDRVFTIDYGGAFEKEPLVCDVDVKTATPVQQADKTDKSASP